MLSDALMFLGIPHLAFEKGERMIEDEARAVELFKANGVRVLTESEVSEL